VVDVIKWPPVGEVAFELSKVDPVSVSTALIDGQPRFSRYGRSRRVAKTSVSGIGPNASGAGYMEMLKEDLKGGINLVRVITYSSIWHFVRAQSNPALESYKIDWTAAGTNLLWVDGDADLQWWNKSITATPTTDGVWPAILVTGLPPNIIVVRPHENISVYPNQGDNPQKTKARRVAMSDSTGTALIRVKDTITNTGQVILGAPEEIVFRPLSLPRSTQPQLGNWQYNWEFVEAFEDEYPEGFVELDPWA
tara:strand:- start:82 stop:834 length:753 start_codon:yes stop_codon:yes gene_type:complete